MPGILDRYILRSFLFGLVTIFISLVGLCVIVHLFTNLDDFLATDSSGTSTLRKLADYYGPQVLQFYDRVGPLVVLLAAMFTITTLVKNNELVSIEAAGISKGRVVTILIVAAAGMSLVGVANREICLPHLREALMRTPKDWSGGQAKPLKPAYDFRTDIFLGGQKAVVARREIIAPHFRLPSELRSFGHQLHADRAVAVAATADHPAGYLLQNVKTPANIDELETARLGEQPAIFGPRDTPWLKSKECFVVSDVAFEQLAGGGQWRQLASTAELLTLLRNPSMDLGRDTRVALHARFVQPLLEFALFMAGLPLVLARESRNLFAVAGGGLLVVLVFLGVKLLCHALGTHYILSPALAAWLPVLLLAPVSYVTAVPLWR